ncbi:MAG: hypothetical protein HY451_00395 [Parcubacteria group bacterium]|nr:hypothetical protein [Parcubacteria group bacterium]
MPKLSKKFVLFGLVSWLLGGRELLLAWTIAFWPQELTPYATQAAMPFITSEVLFLIPGGFFLIVWPIAYRIQTIRKKS